MNNKNIEKSIARAISQAPTLDFEILANVSVVRMTEHDYITRQVEERAQSYNRRFSIAITCCLVILLSFSWWFAQYRVPDSIITIDVNPSIKIITNKQNQILSIKSINEDAQDVVDSLDGNTSDLNKTIDALIKSIIDYGYLNTDKNVIMISVENKSIKKADALSLSLDYIIQDSALSQNITPQVLRQNFTKDKETSALAEQYDISVGKLRLIKNIISSDSELSIEALASRSMEELMDISLENGVDLHKTIQFDDSEGKLNNKASKSDTDQGNNKDAKSEEDKGNNNNSKSEGNRGNNKGSNSEDNQGKGPKSEENKGNNNNSKLEDNQGNNKGSKPEDNQGKDSNSENGKGNNNNPKSENSQGNNKGSNSEDSKGNNNNSKQEDNQNSYKGSSSEKNKGNNNKSKLENNQGNNKGSNSEDNKDNNKDSKSKDSQRNNKSSKPDNN